MSETPEEASIPLSVPVLAGNEWDYVRECLDSGWISASGEYVTRFEDAVRAFTGAPHAVACSSGTAALHVALELAGVNAGHAVIVPTMTFIASANSVRYRGGEPILLDCDAYLNIDADRLEQYLAEFWQPALRRVVDAATGREVRAIMPVHVYGNLCNMERLMDLAERYGLAVVEDATESLGSTFTAGRYAGRHAGTLGTLAALSFNGNKIVTTGGGGMILTGDAQLAARARYLTTQAKDDSLRYVHGAVGYNYRISNVLAAIGVAQMEQLPAFIRVKRRNWKRYADGLEAIPGLSLMDAPEGTDPNRWFYALVIDEDQFGMDRDALMEQLAESGVEARPLWLPIHLQPPYRGCRVVGGERAVWYCQRVLSLPCSSDLRPADVDRVLRMLQLLARS